MSLVLQHDVLATAGVVTEGLDTITAHVERVFVWMLCWCTVVVVDKPADCGNRAGQRVVVAVADKRNVVVKGRVSDQRYGVVVFATIIKAMPQASTGCASL